jgi:hypothetical protein
MSGSTWGWAALFLLGAYHGINPGRGWLFAVALGMQEKSGRAVWRALIPITIGHALAIGVVVLAVKLLHRIIPMALLKWGVAVLLIGLGFHRLFRCWHPRGAGMQAGSLSLAVWSFLMASAHGAGLMLIPVLFGMSSSVGEVAGGHAHEHGAAMLGGPWLGLAAVVVHTAGYLLVTGIVAWLVYEKLGVALLRKAWVNLDLIWAVALLVTGTAVLLMI